MADSLPAGGSPETLVDSPWRAVAVAVGLGLAGPVLAILLSIPTGLGLRAIQPPVEISIVVSLVVWQYLAFGGVAVWYLRRRGLDLAGMREYLGVRVPSLRELLIVLGGWVLIFGMVLATLILIQLVAIEPAQNQTGQLVIDRPQLFPVLIVSMFLIVGPMEELLYRGVVQGRLREALGPVPAIAVASAVFASVHVVALVGSLPAMAVSVAILFPPSLVFGAVYEYTGNLAVPALLHGLHNAVLLALVWVALRYAPEGATLLGAV